MHAVIKVDSGKDFDTIREMISQGDYTQSDLEVVAVQPCQSPLTAAANGHEIVFAPVRCKGAIKPRALILRKMTKTCSLTLVSQKTREASAAPEIPKTIVLQIAAEGRFRSAEEWKLRKRAPAQSVQKGAQKQIGLNKGWRLHDAWGFSERFLKALASWD